jgi:hypothetical protein
MNRAPVVTALRKESAMLAELRKLPSALPQGMAASVLDVSRVRILQLILAGRLEVVSFCGARLVSVSSIFRYAEERKLSKQWQRRQRQSGQA